ncbi:PilZ domain-containing protein [Ferrimonas balearica]|uniref:PilZ domain-containing protein n=1 Tax=Ferrimonas balearica TaxID=44012 RepID=UPI001C99FA70|nr:PilZ domain-containing protein [Ferrimonas balearica]MBY5921895.1 PilZ domain-containing protein [Ferrimonas balearica]MBY5994765.1 PilZ domain-containing protein [Ferrimonas balearica]
MDKHQALIEQLKPLLQEADFDQMFQRLCQDLPSSERFLVKMEMQRLNQTSRQVLDLRDRVSGCREHELGGITHFLTDAAASRLEELMRLYGNRLTVGAIETLLNDIKPTRHQPDTPKAPASSVLPVGHTVPQLLGHYITRGETRRTFTTAIRVHQGGQAGTEGLTLDISVGGCQVRLPEGYRLDPKLPLMVAFTALGQEFLAPAITEGLPYQILKIQRRKGYQYVRLKRQDSADGTEQELSRVIQACSLRTTPEINHLIATTRSHGYERHYLPKLTALPLFFKMTDQQLAPMFTLVSEENQDRLGYWQDERGVGQLSASLGTLRLSRLLQEPDNPAHRLLFSFKHIQQEQVLFFSATLHELEQSELLDPFLAVASQRSSFRVHRMSAHSLSSEDRELALRCPLSGRPADPLVQQQLKEVCLALTLEDITSVDAVERYRQRPAGEDANALRRFGMARLSKDPVRVLPLQHKELRREARFGLRTQALVTTGRKTFAAMTLDVSPRGIKLQLAQPLTIALERDTKLELELPKLQPLAGKLKLKGMPYRLVRAQKDGRTLHIKAEGSTGHTGVVFLSHLLSQNRAKLSEVGSARQHRQITDALNSLMLKRLHCLPVFAHKRHGRQAWDMVGQAIAGNALLSRLAPQLPENLDWLWEQGGLNALLSELKRPDADPSPLWECLVKLPAEGNAGEVLRLTTGLDADDVRYFIEPALEQGRFIALRARVFAANRPDLDYLQQDLAAISTHALHRARELEDMLWQVQGCGQLIDITDEILCRFQLN